MFVRPGALEGFRRAKHPRTWAGRDPLGTPQLQSAEGSSSCLGRWALLGVGLPGPPTLKAQVAVQGRGQGWAFTGL